MTREELGKKLAKKAGLKIAQAEKLINSFGAVISDALMRDEKIVYSNFGTFYKVHYPSKVIYHPQLGKSKKMVMLPTDVVKWMPADNIKRLCNANLSDIEDSVIKHGASKVSKKLAPRKSESAEPDIQEQVSQQEPADEDEEIVIPVHTLKSAAVSVPVEVTEDKAGAETENDHVSIYEEIFDNGGKEESTFGDAIRVPRRPSLWSRIARRSSEGDQVTFGHSAHHYLPSSGLSYDSAALRLVPERLARAHNLAPIKFADNILTLAMTDPGDYEARAIISKTTRKNLSVVLVSQSDLDSILDNYRNILPETRIQEPAASISNDLPHAPIARVLAALFRKAVRSHSSHIHFDPFDDGLRIRLRHDGKIENVFDLPSAQALDATNEIFRLAHLDPDLSDLPQDGTFSLKLEERGVDFHVSTMPILSGNKIVIKIIDAVRSLHKLEELGLEPRELSSLKQILSRKKGLIVFAGEKSTIPIMSMYSALTHIQSPDKIIMTIENPITSKLKDIHQTQVNDKRDLTFAKALHSALAQDPDVVMLSDIPDTETLEMAVQAALTGHLVLAAMSADSTPETIKKLVEMSTKPQALSAGLLAVIAQKDCFGICNECREKANLTSTQMDSLQAFINNMPKDIKGRYSAKTGKLYSIVGCKKCGGSGYESTVALLEYLPISEEMREILVKKPALTTIQRQATKENIITLNQRKIMLALEGKVAIETP